MKLFHITRLLYCIILCIVYSISTSAQEPMKSICKITKYDENSGMSGWHVTQVLQDNNNLMWFATWNGINRYDGYEFKCFKSKVGDGCHIYTNRIRDFRLAQDGNIYCKNDDTLFIFDTQTYSFRDIKPEEEDIVKRTLKTNSQNISLLGDDSKQIVHTDKFGTQWTITQQGTLYYYNENEQKNILYNTDKQLEPIRFCYIDKQGNLWLLAQSGIYKLNFIKSPIKLFPQEKPSQIRCFFLDKQNRYWVTSKEDATIRLFDSNNLFLGYLGIDGLLHTNYTMFEAPVYCIAQSSDGNLWLGSKTGGLFRLREKKANAFEINNFKPEKDAYSINNENIYDIKEDIDGKLWIATLGGGINCMINPKEDAPRFIHSDNELKGYPKQTGNKVRYIHITQNNILLAATTDGLIVSKIEKSNNYSKQHFRLHTKEPNRQNSLSCSATMDILENDSNHIFISTESGGVNFLISNNLLTDTLEFKHFNMQNGLPTDVTLSLTEYNGNIGVVCSNQIVILNPYKEKIISFDANFFLRPCRFSDAHPLLLPNGRWIFGLQDGAFTLSIDEMKKSSYVPSIVITGVSIQNKEINMAVNDTIVLQPDERNITIHFAALDYTETERIKYAFRLGKDNSVPWNYIHNSRSATFLDMQPDKYTLMIQSSNADGVWVDNVRTLTIIVKPTFWETSWAILLYISVICLIITIILYTLLYIRKIKKQQKETLSTYLALINAPHNEKYTEKDTTKQEENTPPTKLTPDEEAFMKRIITFVEEHIGDPNINIGDMASAAATSRSGLNRKMKSILGVTPLEFLHEARIKKACQMIQAEEHPITEIAYKCGFSDPKYFSRCFKKSLGISPTEYKSKQNNP